MMHGVDELALKAAKGDAAAFGLVLERHYDLLYRMAYRFLGRRADAEDVAQEVALALAQKIRQFRGEARFTTWLYRVVLNACRDYGRRAAGQARLAAAFVEVSDRRQADWADSNERLRWLYQALGRLDPAMRETALLVLAEDMSHAEAGEILGVKESTVSWRMHEVRKKLKAMAGQDHD
jgi:RNA polymerase sigma-70 factor, ECF subfamily